jgi:hypothetical protein
MQSAIEKGCTNIHLVISKSKAIAKENKILKSILPLE